MNTEEEASVSWTGSSKQMESRAVLELVSACECQDHPNNRIEGIQGQCQFLGLNTNIQTGPKSLIIYCLDIVLCFLCLLISLDFAVHSAS